MPISVGSQAYIFLCSVIGGAVIALIFDIFRIRRKALKIANFLTYIEDLFFWIIVAIVMFATVYYSNEGELRSYIFIGTALGVILYALLLSKPIMKSSLFIIKLIGKTLRAIWFVITYPFRVIFRFLAIPARFASKQAKKSFRGVRRAGRNRLSRAAIWRRAFKNIRKKI